MKSLSLYDLSQEMIPLEEALEASGGEVTEDNKALVQRLEDLELLTRAKIDSYGFYYKSLEALAKGIRDEESRLGERRRAVENKMKRLKDAVKEAMESRGIFKIEGKCFTVSVQRNGGVPPMTLLVDESAIPESWGEHKWTLDRSKLRAALEKRDAEAMKIARLEEPSTTVRIR